MHSKYIHAISDFEKQTGKSYDDTAYPTPESVHPDLRKLVAKIKTYGAAARDLEIGNELIELGGNDGIANVSEDKEQLLEELKACAASEELWGKYANA